MQSGEDEQRLTLDSTDTISVSIAGELPPTRTSIGVLLVGGLSAEARASLAGDLAAVDGYRGCIGNLHVGGRRVDFFGGQLLASIDAQRGCSAPAPRCELPRRSNNDGRRSV